MPFVRKTNVAAALAALIVLTMSARPAEAGGLFGRRRRAPACEVQAPAMPAYQAPAVPYRAAPALQAACVATGATAPAGDAAGFAGWLNATRGRYGLAPVAYDAAVEADCLINSQHQASRGLGHHWMGCHRRQNSAAGAGFPGVEAMWLASPGHASALLDPSLTRVGIAWYGAYCTFGGY